MVAELNLRGGFFRVICVSGILILSSCTRYYYTPNNHNTPLLKEKGQLNLSGNLSLGEESVSKEAQAAYAVTDKVGVMLNYIAASDNFYKDDAYGFLLEGGAGLYKPIGDLFVAEAFAGTGYSNQSHKYFEYGVHSSSQLSFIRTFIQGDIGISNKVVDVGLSTRFCHLGFTNTASNIPFGTNQYMRLNTVRGSFFLFEPALVFRLGFKYLKLNLQLGGSYCLNARPAFEQNHVSAGLSYCFAKRFRMKRQAE